MSFLRHSRYSGVLFHDQILSESILALLGRFYPLRRRH
mgnify:CR=1 FL=1|jgi:hypothetical protein